MKKIMNITLIVVSIFYLGTVAQADQIAKFEYDLRKTSQLSYETIDNQNNKILIEIEKIPSLSRLAQGTYRISKTLKNRWSITYTISVNTKDQITKATGLNAKAISGSFTSTSLTNSSSSAICSFKQKIGTVTSSGNVTASISKGKLVVK